MTPDFEEITEAARRLASALHIQVCEIVLRDKRGNPRLILPLAAAEPHEANGRENIPLEILKVLREAGKPLTGPLVLEELDRRGVRASKRSVDGHLAELVQDGTLSNPPGVKPPGYRIPD